MNSALRSSRTPDPDFIQPSPPLADTSCEDALQYRNDKAFFAAGVIAARRDSVGQEADDDLVDHLWQGYYFST